MAEKQEEQDFARGIGWMVMFVSIFIGLYQFEKSGAEPPTLSELKEILMGILGAVAIVALLIAALVVVVVVVSLSIALIVWRVTKVPYVRRIKANDYGDKRCAECSVKQRPPWADYSWRTLFWCWIRGIYPFPRLLPGTKMSTAGYVPSTHLIEKAGEEGWLARLLGDTPDECDHVYNERRGIKPLFLF